MITIAQARTADDFHHARESQASGRECYRVRRNGQTQTWATRPGEFRIPVKWGLRGYGQITDGTAADWHVAATCPRCT